MSKCNQFIVPSFPNSQHDCVFHCCVHQAREDKDTSITVMNVDVLSFVLGTSGNAGNNLLHAKEEVQRWRGVLGGKS